MRRAAPLPEPLRGRAFTRDEARAAEVSGPRLGRQGLTNPHRGLWAPPVADTVAARTHRDMNLLPERAAYSHQTAADVLDIPLPYVVQNCVHLHVTTDTAVAQRRRPGWIGHRGLESRHVVEVNGVRVVGLVDTWLDLGALAAGRTRLMTIADLIVAGDAVVMKRLQQLAGPGVLRPHLREHLVAQVFREIDDALGRRPRPRGKLALLAARERIRPGVRSPQESRLRLAVVDGGAPEPEAGGEIREGGTFLAEGDLVWRAQRVVLEYQGQYHAERAQRSLDSFRITRLGDHDWKVIEVWAEDLTDRVRRTLLVRRLLTALEERSPTSRVHDTP